MSFAIYENKKDKIFILGFIFGWLINLRPVALDVGKSRLDLPGNGRYSFGINQSSNSDWWNYAAIHPFSAGAVHKLWCITIYFSPLIIDRIPSNLSYYRCKI